MKNIIIGILIIFCLFLLNDIVHCKTQLLTCLSDRQINEEVIIKLNNLAIYSRYCKDHPNEFQGGICNKDVMTIMVEDFNKSYDIYKAKKNK